MVLSFDGESASVRLPIVEAICHADGRLRAGVVATVADICAGAVSGRLASPDWVATSDIALHLVAGMTTGELYLQSSLIRRGRSLIVIRLEGTVGEERCVAAEAAFAVLPYRGEAQSSQRRRSRSEESQSSGGFELGSPSLEEPIVDKLGVRVLDPSAGVVEMDLTDYVRNTFSALQGGLPAVLAEVAMESRGAHVAQRTVYTTDLRVRYLSQGRVGPFRTSTEVLRALSESILLRVTVLDTGAEDRLVAVATGTVALTGTTAS
jgi:acyl-coenzyme A thioesterase PaaI-like protein